MDASTRPLAPLDVAWIDVPAGRIEPGPDPYHLLDLHGSEPVRASIRLDGRESRATQLYGDINIVPAGSTGRWLLEARASALLLRLAPTLFDEAADAMNLKPVGLALRPAVCVRDPHIEHIGWMIKNERLTDYPSGSLWLESAAYAIALRLVRRSHNSLRVPPLSQRAMPKWRLYKVRDYIEANLDRDLTLRELAAVAGFSVPHFKVLFRNATGLPVHRYVVERRVECARRLILLGKHPMANIALDAGFAHQSHMIRCMQRVLGIRPAQIVALARGSSGSRSLVPAGPQ